MNEIEKCRYAEWGSCRDCIHLRNTCLGTSCKVFGNPWEKDLIKDGGCSQFFEPKTDR